MGTKDVTEKILEDHNDVFADIANVLLFQGALVNIFWTQNYKNYSVTA